MSSLSPGAARIKSFYVNAATTNIPTSYGSGSDSKILTALGELGFNHIKIVNETASRIAICLTNTDAAVPSSSNSANTSQNYTSSTSTEFLDDLHIYDVIYLRSDSGAAITSGIVAIEVW